LIQGESVLTQPLPSAPICAICGKPVELENSKTDSNAEAVHEECYVAKVAGGIAPKNESEK
jgi:hypothetical protein